MVNLRSVPPGGPVNYRNKHVGLTGYRLTIAGAVLAANGPDAIRIGVMLPRAAAYDFALAVIGARMAAKIAESMLPEMRQIALLTATRPVVRSHNGHSVRT